MALPTSRSVLPLSVAALVCGKRVARRYDRWRAADGAVASPRGCRISRRPRLFVVEFSNGLPEVRASLALIRRAGEAVGITSAISLWISPTLWTYATASPEGGRMGRRPGDACKGRHATAPLGARLVLASHPKQVSEESTLTLRGLSQGHWANRYELPCDLRPEPRHACLSASVCRSLGVGPRRPTGRRPASGPDFAPSLGFRGRGVHR